VRDLTAFPGLTCPVISTSGNRDRETGGNLIISCTFWKRTRTSISLYAGCIVKKSISVVVRKKRIRPGNLTAMDTHKTDAELSFLSSGEEVHHPLPVRADDLCFISNTNRKYPRVHQGACFLLFLYAVKTNVPGERPCRKPQKGVTRDSGLSRQMKRYGGERCHNNLGDNPF
jgi:hypothetical protein